MSPSLPLSLHRHMSPSLTHSLSLPHSLPLSPSLTHSPSLPLSLSLSLSLPLYPSLSPPSHVSLTHSLSLLPPSHVSLTHSLSLSSHRAVNKRLDEWVTEDQVDIEKMQLPRKDSKVGALSRQTSRASSPDVHGSTQLDSKKNTGSSNRKRKTNGTEVHVCV